MKEDIACEVIGNIEVCVDRNKGTPFQQTKELHTILRENNESYLKFAKKCKTQGLQCFESNLKALSIYFVIYLIAAIFINLLHEGFHFAMFYFSGEDTSGFSFGFSVGTTYVNSLPDVSSHNILWWYFAIMGPLLVVNFLSIMLVYFIYKPLSSYRIFKIQNPYSNRILEVFLHAIAYLSAIAILINTILSPVMNFLSFNNRYSVKSDFTWAWDMSIEMSEEKYYLSEYYIWIIIILSCILIGLILKSNFKAKNFSIALLVLVVTSTLFFFDGVSDRSLFQWLVISSVTLEVLFSTIYISRFGRKVE